MSAFHPIADSLRSFPCDRRGSLDTFSVLEWPLVMTWKPAFGGYRSDLASSKCSWQTKVMKGSASSQLFSTCKVRVRWKFKFLPGKKIQSWYWIRQFCWEGPTFDVYSICIKQTEQYYVQETSTMWLKYALYRFCLLVSGITCGQDNNRTGIYHWCLS